MLNERLDLSSWRRVFSCCAEYPVSVDASRDAPGATLADPCGTSPESAQRLALKLGLPLARMVSRRFAKRQRPGFGAGSVWWIPRMSPR